MNPKLLISQARFSLAPCAHFARLAGSAFLSLLYPPHCALCLTETEAGAHLCPVCAAKAPKLEFPCCQRCSEPFFGQIDPAFTCPNCQHRRLHFQSAVSAYRSRGVVRELIHRFKYQGHFYLRHQLAHWLADAFLDPRLTDSPADFLVPIPLHPRREREREFNQARELAVLLSRQSGIPVLEALHRRRYTSTQTRLDRHQRMENLRGAFEVGQTCPVHHRHLILIDDVFTTGSTVQECAFVLRRAGASSVRAATVARG